MIRLTREMIDHIFEPKRELAFGEAPEGRLLTDGKSVYCVSRERDGHRIVYAWHRPSRPEPGFTTVWGERRYQPRTWPVWERISSCAEACVPTMTHELLPAPTHQAEILIALYRLALPAWDDIVKIESWPRVSDKTWRYIMDKFMAFDKRMHPGVIPGGAWCLGSGFSNAHNDKDRDSVPDWMIDLSPARIAYKSTPFWFEITESRYGDNDEYSAFRPYIRWNVPLPEPWAKQFMGESLDPNCEKPRPHSLAEAQAQCEERAGCPLTWESVAPEKPEFVACEWRSLAVFPAKETTRAA